MSNELIRANGQFLERMGDFLIGVIRGRPFSVSPREVAPLTNVRSLYSNRTTLENVTETIINSYE